MTIRPNERQRLVDALSQIDVSLADNIERSQETQRRVRWYLAELSEGASVSDLVAAEGRPRAVEMLTANAAVLETAGSDFRANLARALRSEGRTIEAIATLFGVTRQRISALLRQRK